ncbi:MAG: AAA family ATPase [bacterium]|nr:AAA family ATPase [bacterium]
MKNIILAIVGLCGTGKSVAAKYIEENLACRFIYFGGLILEEVKRRGLEINSTNEKMVREDLRDKHGRDVVAKLAIDKINSSLAEDTNVLIDGLYSFSEYLYLKEKFRDQLTLLSIHSAKSLRYQRLGSREVRPLTPKEVDDRDFAEIKNIEKAGPIAIADFHIINDADLQTFYGNIDMILKTVAGT